jgi:hypothetical protein
MVGGAKTGHVTCDTKDSSEAVCGMETSVNDEHSGDCEIKLACNVPAVPAGPAVLHVTGTVGAGTWGVKKMSINVRDK